MRYRLLGRTGLRASEAFLGTTTFGKDWGWGASMEECGGVIRTRRPFSHPWRSPAPLE